MVFDVQYHPMDGCMKLLALGCCWVIFEFVKCIAFQNSSVSTCRVDLAMFGVDRDGAQDILVFFVCFLLGCTCYLEP